MKLGPGKHFVPYSVNVLPCNGVHLQLHTSWFHLSIYTSVLNCFDKDKPKIVAGALYTLD
jgi:hypothetical protein